MCPIRPQFTLSIHFGITYFIVSSLLLICVKNNLHKILEFCLLAENMYYPGGAQVFIATIIEVLSIKWLLQQVVITMFYSSIIYHSVLQCNIIDMVAINNLVNPKL